MPPSNPLLQPKTAWHEIEYSQPAYSLLGGILESDEDISSWAENHYVDDRKAFFEMFRGKKVAVVDFVGTNSGYQKQGYGKQAVTRLLREAGGHGCHAIVLMAGGYENEPGFDIVRWYEGQGFRGTGLSAEGIPLMIKWLNPPRTAGAAGELPEISVQLDILDSRRGEVFGRVEAWLGKGGGWVTGPDGTERQEGTRIGHVDFSEYEGEVWVKWVHVEPEFRRHGVGTAMYQKIKEEFPGEPITSGGTTGEGTPFRESLKGQGIVAAAIDYGKVVNILHSLMPDVEGGLPCPQLRIVNQMRSNWDGRCEWTFGKPNTTIVLQKSVCSDEGSLRRVIAHELCHHEQFLLNWSKFPSVDTFRLIIRLEGGHGKAFTDIADRWNAKHGKDFVTEKSDERIFREYDEKPFFVFLQKFPLGNSRPIWQASTRLTDKQRRYMMGKNLQQYRLVQTTDRRFVHAPVIGSGRGWQYIPMEKHEWEEAIQALFNQPDLRLDWTPIPPATPKEQKGREEVERKAYYDDLMRKSDDYKQQRLREEAELVEREKALSINKAAGIDKKAFINNDLIWLKHYLTMDDRQKGEELARSHTGPFFDFVKGQPLKFPIGKFRSRKALLNAIEEYDEDVFSVLPPKVLTDFLEKEGQEIMENDPADAPSFLHMSYEGIVNNTWLVHMTNHATDIQREGFTKGMHELDKLGLTTYFKNEAKEYGGYNFAVPAKTAYKENIEDYGNHAVVFRASGVLTYHFGDGFNQVIFWGADARDIVPIYYRDEWSVSSDDGRVLFKSSDFQATVDWVIANFDQYRRALNPGPHAKPQPRMADVHQRVTMPRNINKYFEKLDVSANFDLQLAAWNLEDTVIGLNDIKFPLVVYRALEIPKGYKIDFNNTGTSWTLDADNAYAYFGASSIWSPLVGPKGQLWTLRAELANENQVDWEGTLRANVKNPNENEIRLIEGVSIKLTGILGPKYKEYKPMVKMIVASWGTVRYSRINIETNQGEALGWAADTEGEELAGWFKDNDVAEPEKQVSQIRGQHRRFAVLNNIEVFDRFRGEGYGSKLLKKFVSVARREKGATIILLNAAALTEQREGFNLMEWYESNGFKEFAHPVGGIIMARTIKPPITADSHKQVSAEIRSFDEMLAERFGGSILTMVNEIGMDEEDQGKDKRLWRDVRWSYDSERISYRAKFNFPINVFRALSLKKNIKGLRQNEAGLFWALHEEGADTYWAFGLKSPDDQDWILQARAAEGDIDWEMSLVHEILYREEDAILMRQGAVLPLIGVKELGTKRWLKPPWKTITASHKQTQNRENVFEDIGQGEGTEGYALQPECVDGTVQGIPLDELEEQVKLTASDDRLMPIGEFIRFHGGMRRFLREYGYFSSNGDNWEEAEKAFRGHYSKVMNVFNGWNFPLNIYRMVALKGGIKSLVTDALGIYWSWDEAQAYPWGAMVELGDLFLLRAKVNREDIDWEGTLTSNLQDESFTEGEVTLKEGSHPTLIAWKPENNPQVGKKDKSRWIMFPTDMPVTASMVQGIPMDELEEQARMASREGPVDAV